MVSFLRQKLAETSRTLESISTETGISRVHLSRFKAGDAGLSMENANRLAASLGLASLPVCRLPRGTKFNRPKTASNKSR